MTTLRDGCKFCLGAKGGVPGNANVVGGEVICDYCTALLMEIKDAEKANPTSSIFAAQAVPAPVKAGDRVTDGIFTTILSKNGATMHNALEAAGHPVQQVVSRAPDHLPAAPAPTERDEFESWYAPLFAGGHVANMPRRSNGEYVRPQAQIAWLAYSAALAARRAPFAPVVFGMRGQNMTFTIGAQSFTLDYKPDNPESFAFMSAMLTKAIVRAALPTEQAGVEQAKK